jgi:hypothetical protein
MIQLSAVSYRPSDQSFAAATSSFAGHAGRTWVAVPDLADLDGN